MDSATSSAMEGASGSNWECASATIADTCCRRSRTSESASTACRFRGRTSGSRLAARPHARRDGICGRQPLELSQVAQVTPQAGRALTGRARDQRRGAHPRVVHPDDGGGLCDEAREVDLSGAPVRAGSSPHCIVHGTRVKDSRVRRSEAQKRRSSRAVPRRPRDRRQLR